MAELIEVKPNENGTRLRQDHNTYAKVLITDLGPSSSVKGDLIWVAPSDGAEVKAGDQWLHTTIVNGSAKDGWIAIVHKGVSVCKILPPEEPEQPFVWPDSIELVTDDNQRAFYDLHKDN